MNDCLFEFEDGNMPSDRENFMILMIVGPLQVRQNRVSKGK